VSKAKRKPLDARTLRCAASYVAARSWNDAGRGEAFKLGVKAAARMLRSLAGTVERKAKASKGGKP
jgi:hypothetical protein